MPILADDLLVAGLARDHDDLGIGLRALVVGVDEDLAEAAREGLVARHVELLVAEEDDAVVEQGLADVADGALVEVRADVDIVDLGADGAGNGPHLDPAVAHHVSSGCVLATRLWRAPFLRNSCPSPLLNKNGERGQPRLTAAAPRPAQRPPPAR